MRISRELSCALDENVEMEESCFGRRGMRLESYFVRHTSKLSIQEKYLEDLWQQNRIAVHFPGHPLRDSPSVDPEDYEGHEKAGISCLRELSKAGGYVWAMFWKEPGYAKVGKVRPGTPIRIARARWSRSPEGVYRRKEGQLALLKTLKLTHVKRVGRAELTILWSAVPQQITIARWRAARTRVADEVEHRTPRLSWDNLSTPMQEAICAEFLRYHRIPGLPRLAHLLAPVGRTMPGVDIYGITRDGTQIFGQVTYATEGESREKQATLRRFKGRGNALVFLCRCDAISKREGMILIPVDTVWHWLRRRPYYLRRLPRA